MGKLKEKKKLGDFQQWTKAVKTKGGMTLGIFTNIFEHYHTMHNKEKALEYAMETAAKVEAAAGVKKTANEYEVFEHKGVEVKVPYFIFRGWVKKAEKTGIISVDINDEVENYLNTFTDASEEKLKEDFWYFVYALDAYVAERAHIKVDPESPITYRTKLEFKDDHVVFASEKYGEKKIPYYLYNEWMQSLISEGTINPDTFSQMHKYAKTGMPKEPKIASFETGKRFFLSIMSDLHLEKPQYPGYFTSEMDGLMKKELEKLAKLKLKPPKKKAGKIMQISKDNVSILPAGQETSIQIDPKIYSLVYNATVENGGKVPNWARQKLYSHFMDVAFEYYGESKDFDEIYSKEALDKTALLVPFFEYQVAADAQAAKKILEKEKKLKVVPKK